MSVQGKTKENVEFTKKTGFFEGKVVAINPTKSELEKMLSVEIDNEIDYTSTEEIEGKEVKRSQIVFWVKDEVEREGSHGYRSIRFFLKDLDRTNTIKPEEEGTKVRKRQYINSIGITTWADSVDNLQDWFKERDFRVARVGEEELYTFIGSWLNKLDRKDKDTLLAFDWKRLISGNVKELTDQIGGEYDATVVALVTIRVVEKEGEKKEYEQVYSRDFMPGFAMKQVRTKKVDADFIAKAKITERKKRSLLQRFVLGVTDSQFGVKDYYSLGELEDYDPTKNPVASDKVLAEDDTSY